MLKVGEDAEENDGPEFNRAGDLWKAHNGGSGVHFAIHNRAFTENPHKHLLIDELHAAKSVGVLRMAYGRGVGSTRKARDPQNFPHRTGKDSLAWAGLSAAQPSFGARRQVQCVVVVPGAGVVVRAGGRAAWWWVRWSEQGQAGPNARLCCKPGGRLRRCWWIRQPRGSATAAAAASRRRG